MTTDALISPFRAYFALTTAALCWAGNAIFGRLAVGEVSPLLLVSCRWLGALMLVLVFARHYLVRDWPVLRTHLRFIFAMGALGFAMFNTLFYIAAHTTTAVNLGILQGAIPVFVILSMFVAYRVRVTRVQLAGVCMTIIGVVTVSAAGSFERLLAMEFRAGDMLMIAACALYAGYTVALRHRPATSALGLFGGFVAAAFLTSIPLAVTEAMLGQLQWPTAKGWAIICLVSVFPSFLAQICFIQGVSSIGPNRAGVFVNLVPVFAALMAVLFLRESFETFHAVALAFVLCGIWLSERGKPA